MTSAIKMAALKKWRLQNKHERRFKLGHPWVFSNELQDSPKGVAPGELVELCDSGGAFLSYGIANPASLIAFRALSRQQDEAPFFAGGVVSKDFFLSRFKVAQNFRQAWFDKHHSYRLIFGEVDDCPGLVIDRYSNKRSVAYVVQPHSAGMDKNLESVIEALQQLAQNNNDPGYEAGHAAVILRRDAGSREREGLEKLPVEIRNLKTNAKIEDAVAWSEFTLCVPGVMGTTIEMTADLVKGQKTGFFLDQLQNIRLVETLLLRKIRLNPVKRAKILDLCAYVGQWSVHLTQTYLEREASEVEVTLVDASDTALKMAEKNVTGLANTLAHADQKVAIIRQKADVLEPMPFLKNEDYDVVIADPPALIKNRKHIPQGTHAYVSLMTTAIGKVRDGGLIVACSCSQLLSPDDFKVVLDKATRKSKRPVRWIAQGSPSVDHFSQFHFQEGHYLKCWIGQVGP